MTKEERHLVTISPAMKFGEPCIDDRRFTVQQVAEMWWYGNWPLDKLADPSWPNMTRGAVLTCCWYMARYGSRTWRKRWGNWLDIADIELWERQYKTCPMPPQKQEQPQ